MNPFLRSCVVAALLAVAAQPLVGGPTAVPAGMVAIPAGVYRPLLRTSDEPDAVPVAPYWLDARPVTNAEFLEFVRANPQWRRSAVSPLFADQGYLGDWAGDLELGERAPADAPVVRVSWFAARAFAKAAGKRLPTTAEWERAAGAGFTSEDGAAEPGFAAWVLGWLARPARAGPISSAHTTCTASSGSGCRTSTRR